MATFIHSLQGVTPTTIAATDTLQFAGGTFDSKITVDAYNSSTHVKTDADVDKSAANTPENNKFISMDGGTAGVSQADWGDGTEDLDSITDAECALKINFAHETDVECEDAIFYAYDGSTTTDGPVGMLVHAAESGDEHWSGEDVLGVAGSAKAIDLVDKSVAGQSHDYFIAISAKPTSVGAKTGKYRCELTYF